MRAIIPSHLQRLRALHDSMKECLPVGGIPPPTRIQTHANEILQRITNAGYNIEPLMFTHIVDLSAATGALMEWNNIQAQYLDLNSDAAE